MTIEEIKNLAIGFSESGKKWHFHILTPECMLNDSGKYRLILENVTDGQVFVVDSDKPYMDVGKELLKLLHGNQIAEEEEEDLAPASEKVTRILDRAKELAIKKIFWHHHMLFPGCKYNKHGEKWVIVFEDMENGEIIESITDMEPKNDLKYIEKLFYSQSKR